MDVKDWVQIGVLCLGFVAQFIAVKNDVNWIKDTLKRHERLIMNALNHHSINKD